MAVVSAVVAAAMATAVLVATDRIGSTSPVQTRPTTPPGSSPTTVPTVRPAAATGWTTYHGDPLGSGVAPTDRRFTGPGAAWTSPTLYGQLYGEPLVYDGLVVVATEHDVVYALRAANGTVAWSMTVGSPVPSSMLPCGDISPTVGITSTPVIDMARSEVFVVADVLSGRVISHHLVGLDLSTGQVLLDQAVDPPGRPSALLQRAGLALDRGSVEIGFGGNYGDCATYHGWLVSVPESGGAGRTWEADAAPGNDQGAIWMGGAAPVVDAGGNLWVTTGNGSNTTGPTPNGSDSVVELSPSLTVEQTFTPTTWPRDNADDLDLGSSPPVLLANGYVLQIGKSQTAYLLHASHLGGVGGQAGEQANLCGGVYGGEAWAAAEVYLPCSNGVEAVRVQPGNPEVPIGVLWSAPESAGPPIVVGSEVWTISQGGVLYGLDRASGRIETVLPLGSPPANHFPTPAIGDGLLLATTAHRVVAFR